MESETRGLFGVVSVVGGGVLVSLMGLYGLSSLFVGGGAGSRVKGDMVSPLGDVGTCRESLT